MASLIFDGQVLPSSYVSLFAFFVKISYLCLIFIDNTIVDTYKMLE